MNGVGNHVRPGILEIYTGNMKSGKTRELINRLDKLSYVNGVEFVLIKPSRDTRDASVRSRFGELSIDCEAVDASHPEQVAEHVDDSINVVAFDEVQLFSDGIDAVIDRLLAGNKHVIGSGLDLTYRAEPFGPMGLLLAKADVVHKQYAICDVDGCNQFGRFPQRFTNGEPSHYDEETVLIEGADAHYEARCRRHHILPGKPTS